MEQVHLIRKGPAVLANVFQPTKAVSNVVTNIDGPGVHAGAHDLPSSRLRGQSLPTTPTASKL
jgi:hypothetical protein